MSADMPDRYRPDPWIDVNCFPDVRRGNVNANVPAFVCRKWLGVDPGDEVGFTEVSTGFRFGPDVPRDAARARVSSSGQAHRPRLRVPVGLLSRLHASPDGTVRIHREDGTARITNPIPDPDDL